MKNPNSKPISVAVVGMDTKTRRILEMVFRGPGKDDYVLVEQIQLAQACIFDLDSLEGIHSWKDYRTQYSHIPTIILSLHHKDIAGTVYVKKPIEVHLLLTALNKIKKLSTKPTVSIMANLPAEKRNTGHPLSMPMDAKLATEIAMEEEEESIHQFCGYSQDYNLSSSPEIEKIYYNPEQYLQGFFEKAFAAGQRLEQGGILIEGLYTPVIFLPQQNQLLCGCELGSSKLRTMTLLPLGRNRLHMANLSETEIIHYLAVYQLSGQPLENFLWRVALWTARGRIPKGTDLHKDVILLHWPNFTRLVVTPYALKISALWITQPYSLLETARVLNIPQRYVFAFYSAAHALKLALVDRRATPRTAKLTPNEKRGLFQRILARLRNQE
ncbi:MAG: hypothetical protein HC877_07785 [Thioploca sp.]|nr:hypothetical protein [Thioploca sp.]